MKFRVIPPAATDVYADVWHDCARAVPLQMTTYFAMREKNALPEIVGSKPARGARHLMIAAGRLPAMQDG